MNADAKALAASFDLEKLTPEFYDDPYLTYRALRRTSRSSACRTAPCS